MNWDAFPPKKNAIPIVTQQREAGNLGTREACPALGRCVAHPALPISVGTRKLVEERVGNAGGTVALPCQQQGGPNYRRWVIESRFKIKSSRLLIIAGILSSWLLSNAGFQPPSYFQVVA